MQYKDRHEGTAQSAADDHDYVEAVARHLFERQTRSYDADPAMIELAWIDDDIRAFWLAEAASVLSFIDALAA